MANYAWNYYGRPALVWTLRFIALITLLLVWGKVVNAQPSFNHDGYIQIGEVSWAEEGEFLLTPTDKEYLRMPVAHAIRQLMAEAEGDGEVILLSSRSLAAFSQNEREDLHQHGWLLEDRHNAVLSILQERVDNPLKIRTVDFVPPAYRDRAECGPDKQYTTPCGFRGVQIFFKAGPRADISRLRRDMERLYKKFDKRLRKLELDVAGLTAWRDSLAQQPEPELAVEIVNPIVSDPLWVASLVGGASPIGGMSVPREAGSPPPPGCSIGCTNPRGATDIELSGSTAFVAATGGFRVPLSTTWSAGADAGPGIAFVNTEEGTLKRGIGYIGAAVSWGRDWAVTGSLGGITDGSSLAPVATFGIGRRF